MPVLPLGYWTIDFGHSVVVRRCEPLPRVSIPGSLVLFSDLEPDRLDWW